jgi:prephenate dehydratase
MRLGYLGPEGTFSEQALLASPLAAAGEHVALPTIHDTVMAVQDGAVDRALVPIENAVEGAVRPTLDALAGEARDVVIVGEAVLAIRTCLIAAPGTAQEDIAVVLSHPQPLGQCAGFLRRVLPRAEVRAATSTAEAVRSVAEHGGSWAALGPRRAAERYGCAVLDEGIDDDPDNATRFVWLAPPGTAPDAGDGPWKTSLVFSGAGDAAPGWLVRCLSEFAFRGVNLTMIESRPRKRGLGHYVFFADLEGRDRDPAVAAAVEAVRGQTEQLRVLGSYPAA